jgi:hypothetical protein
VSWIGLAMSSDRARWINEAFIIQTDGELHRVAISLDDEEAQKRTLRESVGEPPDAVEMRDGTLWVDRRAAEKELPDNRVASMLAGVSVLGTVVFTGRDSSGGIADLGGSAVQRLWACSKLFQRAEPDTDTQP